MKTQGDTEESAAQFAERFNRLNQVLYSAEVGRPYTEQEIAAQVGLSTSQVSNLRNGRSLPRADRAHRLAQLYGVTADFFFLPPDAPYVVDVESQLDAIEQERRGVPQHRANRSAGSSAGDDEVRRIAEGVADLPPDMRETVAKLVDQLRQVAGRRRLRRHSRS